MPHVASTSTCSSVLNRARRRSRCRSVSRSCPGVQGPPGPVQRVAGQAAVAVQFLLNPAATPVQRVPSQADYMKGIHHSDTA